MDAKRVFFFLRALLVAGLLVFAFFLWRQWKQSTLVAPAVSENGLERVYGEHGFFAEGSREDTDRLELLYHDGESDETLEALESLTIMNRTLSAAVYESRGPEQLSAPVAYYVNLPSELEKGEGALLVYALDVDGMPLENTFFRGGEAAWITDHTGRFLLARVEEEQEPAPEEESVTPTPTPRPMHYYVNTSVNIRSGPSTDSPILGSLEKGDPVDVLDNEESPDWYRIRYQGDVAYVNRHFVEEQQ